ncbi:ESX secretion-associated protein EspG [Nocardia vermiculata]|uniref:ESX secretion-associated protein EspG n=1 Tax=Nocardia vermiculata TaxID=257274 RepID=A0A846Y155_9NOCA|nr:ESX secretion-associated protein EspG [Nocardia vermiculata]NKY53003.1 ESX secretion-associated protein EspG [Nocardia vermiculata]
MAEWNWEPDDFAALWLGDARDRLPRPLSYTSRFAGANEARAHRIAVRARYQGEEAEQIRLAFHTLDTCRLRIQVLGESTTLGNGQPREYRVLSARNDDHAVMLTQTAADGIHGRIRCRLFRTEQMAPRLAHILPTCPPGTAPKETFHLDELRQQTQAGYGRSARERYERRIRGTRVGGVAGLLTGPLHTTTEPWFTAQWLDVAGDGRYLQQVTREHLSIRPADTGALTSLFNAWIDRAWKQLQDNAYQIG